MENNLTLETARGMETAQLLGALHDALKMAAENTYRACVAVTVLEEREVPLPMLPQVYRYARDIAEGRLSAYAGLTLGQHKLDLIKAIQKLPIDMQDEIADGKRIKVAVKVDGRVQSRELTIFEMTQLQMRLAFSEGGITPWEEQGEWLHKAAPEKLAEKPIERKPTISVDSKTREIIIGRQHLTVDDLIPALSALGYVTKPAYGAKGIQPVKVK